MQGLIYKDMCLFFKSMEKRLLAVVAVCVILILAKTGIYGGLIASVMLAMSVGVQSVLSFESDEKADWKKYQMAMPVSNTAAVASKYISVLALLIPGILSSVLLNLLSSLIYGCWDPALYVLSGAAAILIPLIWTAVCLPLTYWFGFHSAQVMSMICVFPMVYFIKFFEDGPGMAALPHTADVYLAAAAVIIVLLFLLSYLLSVAGYSRKK